MTADREHAALRVALVDDEPLGRARLRRLVEALSGAGGLPALAVVGEAGDADAAEALLDARGGCDLVLLDVAMPGRDGLRLADALRRRPDAPQVVFVTAHAEHALRAFDLDATDYLTKPVRRDRLEAALARATARCARLRAGAHDATPEAAAGGLLVFADRGRVLRLPLAEIVWLKAGDKLVELHAARGRFLVDESLAELLPRLGAGFLRVHRNAVVATAAVRTLERGAADADGDDAAADGWRVRLADGTSVGVSRRQLPAVREALAGNAGR